MLHSSSISSTSSRSACLPRHTLLKASYISTRSTKLSGKFCLKTHVQLSFARQPSAFWGRAMASWIQCCFWFCWNLSRSLSEACSSSSTRNSGVLNDAINRSPQLNKNWSLSPRFDFKFSRCQSIKITTLSTVLWKISRANETSENWPAFVTIQIPCWSAFANL